MYAPLRSTGTQPFQVSRFPLEEPSVSFQSTSLKSWGRTDLHFVFRLTLNNFPLNVCFFVLGRLHQKILDFRTCGRDCVG